MPINFRGGKFFYSAAVFSLVATCFSLPVATPLLSLFSSLTLLFWLLSGRIKDVPEIVKYNSVVFFAVLLLLLFVLGLIYSSAELSESLSYLKKYRELLFFPVVFSLLHDNPKAAKRCEGAFLIGCVLLMLISYGMYFSIIPTAKYGYSVLYHITHNFFLSIFAFFAVHKAVDAVDRKIKALWLTMFLLSVCNMFYVATGRTGLVVFFFLMVLFFIQRFSLVKQIVSFALLILLTVMVFQTSETFRTRTQAAVGEIQAYEYGASRTSLGMRFDWWIDCLLLIKEKPVLGYGTGSFTTAHDAFIKNTKIQKTDNPHNEFLLIGTQLGLVGVIIFVMIFISQFVCSLKLKEPEGYFTQGIMVAMVIGCLTNSFLFDSHQGHFWAIISAVYFSSSIHCRILGKHAGASG